MLSVKAQHSLYEELYTGFAPWHGHLASNFREEGEFEQIICLTVALGGSLSSLNNPRSQDLQTMPMGRRAAWQEERIGSSFELLLLCSKDGALHV